MFGQLALRCHLSIQSLMQGARDEDGQTLAEYGLILSVVAVAVVVAAAITFRDAIVTSFASATKCLSGSC
jgi:Flp pilus assembly pilin Flp